MGMCKKFPQHKIRKIVPSISFPNISDLGTNKSLGELSNEWALMKAISSSCEPMDEILDEIELVMLLILLNGLIFLFKLLLSVPTTQIK